MKRTYWGMVVLLGSLAALGVETLAADDPALSRGPLGTRLNDAAVGTETLAADPAGDPGGRAPISFRYEVLPVLTKAGCNAGTCHGTPTGKNGFRLSLRGYDPVLDFQTLTREVQGRRIDRLDAGRSLILLKATAQIPHEGGRRFDSSSDACRILRTWVAQGAGDDPAAAPLVRLEIAPDSQLVENGQTALPLSVTAEFADGTRRDVTGLSRFSVNDQNVAAVSAAGHVERRKRGEATVSAEYAGRFAAATVVFREQPPGYVWPDPPEHNDIDRLVFARLKLLEIEPSPLSSDEDFVRRVHLDVTGRLPAAAAVQGFLADADPDKRARLIDDLVERPEFADWWAMKWADRLGCNQRFVGKTGAIKYHAWIRAAMGTNLPEDEFVRALVTAAGPNYSLPAASFWRRLRRGGIGERIDPRLAAEEISQLFLGVRMQCARCHNHPQERWTQNDYYGLAAFFPRMRFKPGPFVNHQYDQEETVYLITRGDVDHPATGTTVAPTVLDGQAETDDDHDRRVAFARWLTAAENPFFARAAVNRIWYHLFGRGLVEPVDDFRLSNPPSHPELLEALTAEFVENGFDRRYLIRKILKSRTYQLSSRPLPGNADDEKYFSHARVRLLGAEAILDAVCDATGVAESYPGFPPGTRAVQLPDGEYKHPFLDSFGRPARALACECERETGINLEQALQLVSGRAVHEKISNDAGRAAQLAASERTNAEIVEELYLATLSRPPQPVEREYLVERIAAAADRRRVVEDVLWSLVNHEEFLFQH